jgi:signal-transduction protein with cAMP-binding, CBS, and nucleotidyltransferase domain
MVPDYHQFPDGGLRPTGFRMEMPQETRVSAVMTPWVISVEEDTPVPELARQILAKKIHRVIITRDGRLCGIVTSLDLLRALLMLFETK